MKDERKQPGGYLLPPSLWGILQFTSRWRIEQVVPSTRCLFSPTTRQLAQSEPIEG